MLLLQPYAAFSHISLLSFHCQPRLELNCDGCIPAWNDSAGCEYGPCFATYCCHLVSAQEDRVKETIGGEGVPGVDDAATLSNWGDANMIRPNLKDDLCLPLQRRVTVTSQFAERQNGSVWWQRQEHSTRLLKDVFFTLPTCSDVVSDYTSWLADSFATKFGHAWLQFPIHCNFAIVIVKVAALKTLSSQQ